MLDVFTHFANWLSYDILQLRMDTPLAKGIHFFIEDTSKILVLLVILIYIISALRASLSVDKVRDYLQGRAKGAGYFLGSLLGAVTPFCSCSSIPLFMGFVSARIPIGVTIAFLITSPLINEVVVIMLGSVLGLKFTVMYVSLGLLLGMLAGFLLDMFGAHRWLQPFLAKAYQQDIQQHGHTGNLAATSSKKTLKQRHQFAISETATIVKRIWIWVLIGVGVGAFIHGYVPAHWLEAHFSNGQWWSVPLAALAAIPMYSNATGIVPIMGSLIDKGMPLGTTLAFCMGAVAVSLPEYMMLKQIMTVRLLGAIAAYLLVSISIIGWLFNFFY
ncbi:permease [Vibrio ezurae]|uniref:Permease n=1 Tax=Vibrio ezurae NBRC 102218 TaxID=1219080 RepID=U3AJM7_9VIBR|nr:permease [Vibrio ezurae]GAD80131.1 hypothetical protein VEZ01S_25_00140 [Vibrio ezurae NBRC 102218]